MQSSIKYFKVVVFMVFVSSCPGKPNGSSGGNSGNNANDKGVEALKIENSKHEKEIDSNKKKIKSLETELLKYKAENKTLKEEQSHVSNNLPLDQNQSTGFDEIRKELGLKNSELEQKNKKPSEVEKKLKDLENKKNTTNMIPQSGNEDSANNTQLTYLTQENQKKDDDINILQAQIKDISIKLSEKESEISSNEKLIKKLTEEINSKSAQESKILNLESEINKLKIEILETQSKLELKEKELNNENAEKKSKILSFESSSNELTKKIEKIEEEKSTLESSIAKKDIELMNRNTKIDELKNDVEKKEEKIKELEQQLKNNKEILEANVTNASALEAIKKQNSDNEKSLKNQIEDLKKTQLDYEKVKKEKGNLEIEIEAVKKQLSEKIESIDSLNSEKENLMNELEEIKNTNEKSKGEIESLKLSFNNKKKIISNNEARIEELEAKVKEYNQKLGEQKNESIQELENKKNEIKEKENELEKYIYEKEESTTNKKKLEDKLKELNNSLEKCENNLKSTKQDLDAKKSDILSKEQQLKKIEEENNKLKLDIKQLYNAKQELVNKYETLGNEKNKLEKQLEDKLQETKILSQAKQELQEKNEILISEKNEVSLNLASTKEKLNSEIDSLKAQVGTLENKIISLDEKKQNDYEENRTKLLAELKSLLLIKISHFITLDIIEEFKEYKECIEYMRKLDVMQVFRHSYPSIDITITEYVGFQKSVYNDLLSKIPFLNEEEKKKLKESSEVIVVNNNPEITKKNLLEKVFSLLIDKIKVSDIANRSISMQLNKLYQQALIQAPRRLCPESVVLREQDVDKINFLQTTLEQEKGKRIVGCEMLYRFDPLNKITLHHYVDNRKDLLLIIKTVDGFVLGAFIENIINEILVPGKGFIYSLTNMFKLNWTNKHSPNARVSQPDEFNMVYGNIELRIKVQSDVCFSNLGLVAYYFDSIVRGIKVNDLLGGGAGVKEVNMKVYEYYQIRFEGEKYPT